MNKLFTKVITLKGFLRKRFTNDDQKTGVV